MEEFVRNFGLTLLTVMAVAGVLALILLVIIVIQVRRIHVPEDANFAETLLYTPLLVVMFLDLLDLALDIFAAPIAWIVLSRLGLKGLRGVTAVEAFIPFTQMVPTMTAAWFGVRLLGKDRFLESKYYNSN